MSGLLRRTVLIISFLIPAILLPTQMSAQDEKSTEALHEEFSRTMANTVMVGTFTIDGRDSDQPLKPERYEIETVTHAAGNLWVFTARIKYGNLDTKLPITVPVEWAGDTPVVTLTNASLPGLGEEFSARVVFYDGRYAGTWQHGKIGGHMFGRIEKQEPAADQATDNSSAK